MSDPLREQYAGVGEELKRRIVALIPDHPEIMEFDDPWPLFKVDGFKCDDLGPTLAQAAVALRHAQREMGDEHERQS